MRSENLEIADLLIAAGAKVNAATRYNITPLSLACGNGNAAMIERLLKAGADANGTSEEGQTALMTAALAGNVDAVKVLLTHGAKVNVQEPVEGPVGSDVGGAEGNTAAAALLIEFGGRCQGQIEERVHSASVCRARRPQGHGRVAAGTRSATPTTRLPTAPARSTWPW